MVDLPADNSTTSAIMFVRETNAQGHNFGDSAVLALLLCKGSKTHLTESL